MLVSDPEPAVVLYDTTGLEVGRTPVDVPAPAIVEADRLTDTGGTTPTPSVRGGVQRFSIIGDTLLAVSQTVRDRAGHLDPDRRRVSWPGPRCHRPPG